MRASVAFSAGGDGGRKSPEHLTQRTRRLRQPAIAKQSRFRSTRRAPVCANVSRTDTHWPNASLGSVGAPQAFARPVTCGATARQSKPRPP